MNKQLVSKITTLSFLGAAILTHVVVNILFRSMGGSFASVQKLYSIPWLSHGLPVASAIVVFAVLQFTPKIVDWAHDVIVEASKVVWPSRKDTFAMTVVVCVFVGIASVLLMVIDFVARELVSVIIQ